MTEIVSTITIMLTRTAVLLLYTRIFSIQTFFMIVATVLHILNIVWGVGFTIHYIFQCWPIEAVWKGVIRHRTNAKCANPVRSRLVYPVSSVILDALVLLIPWPYIFRLHMPWKDKFAVAVMFFLGVL